MASGYGRRRSSVADPPGHQVRSYANTLQQQGSHHSQGLSHHIAQREVVDHVDLRTPDFHLQLWHHERQQAARRQGSVQQSSHHQPSQHQPSQHQDSRRASTAGHPHLPPNARIIACVRFPSGDSSDSDDSSDSYNSSAAPQHSSSYQPVSRRALTAGHSYHPSNPRIVTIGSTVAGDYERSRQQASQHQVSRRASNAGHTQHQSNARVLNGVGSFAPVNYEPNNQLTRRSTITAQTPSRGLASMLARPVHEIREVNGRMVQVRHRTSGKEGSRRASAAQSQYQPDREGTHAVSGYARSNALVARRPSNAGSYQPNSKAVVVRRQSNADRGHGLSNTPVSRRESNAGTQAYHAPSAADKSGLLQRFRRASLKTTTQGNYSNKRSREQYENQYGAPASSHNQHAQHESSKRHKASAPAPPPAAPERKLRRVKPFVYNGRRGSISAQPPKTPVFDPTEVYPGYKLVLDIAPGGMSDAVKIVKNRAGKVFVEKRIKMKNAGTVRRAKLEIRVLTRVSASSNPNLNRFVSSLWGPQESHVAMLLEYCDKGNVAEYVERKYQVRGHRIPESFLWHVLQGIANGLAYLHEGIENAVVNPNPPRLAEKWNTIYHLDIKPENIFLSSTPAANGQSASYYPRVVIGDFGCASTDNMGWQAGTPSWEPPEGSEKFGKHTDTWMAGATIHACALWLDKPDRKLLSKDREHPVGFGYSDRLTMTIRKVTYADYRTRWNALRIVDESTRALKNWAL